MKTVNQILITLWIVCAAFLVRATGVPVTPEAMENSSRVFVESLRQGTADKNPEIFSEQMRAALQGFNLIQLWQQLERQMGPFEAFTRFVHQPGEKFYIILAVTKFRNAEISLRLVFDDTGRIAGLQVAEAPPLSYTPPPPYAQISAFTETEIQIPCGAITLPAKLTMPHAPGKVPLVILVHGSGPHDMDQTIGPNKPFRDLAWGLASKGVAVIRYEKRTRHNPASLNLEAITPWEETGADAVMAAQFATNLPGIDPNSIFVLGHSLGGMMAPKIAERAENLAGIIILGGNSGKLYDLVIRQLSHLTPIQDPENKHGMKELTENARIKAQNIALGLIEPNTPQEETLLNLPASYWLYVREYDQIETAARLHIPILILQGERDYQVDMQEFNGWKAGLAHRNNVKFVLFPKLNHLFFAGEGVSCPAEYSSPNHIDAQVVKEIAAWILQQ